MSLTRSTATENTRTDSQRQEDEPQNQSQIAHQRQNPHGEERDALTVKEDDAEVCLWISCNGGSIAQLTSSAGRAQPIDKIRRCLAGRRWAAAFTKYFSPARKMFPPASQQLMNHSTHACHSNY